LTAFFVDSSAWVALMVQRDQHHRTAREFLRGLAGGDKLITTNYVMQETVTLLLHRGYRAQTRALRDMWLGAETSRLLSTIWIGAREHEASWDILFDYNDQDFSFVDCSSVAVCRAQGITDVFGFDNDFVIAGLSLRP
jgi:predicted nucleic acid-binding protein